MNMNRREQTLVAAVAGLVLVFLGHRMLERSLRAPLRLKNAQIEGLKETVEQREQRQQRGFESRKDLEQWNQQSLPPDARLAQNLYMSWLVGLVDRSGMEQATVTPNLITPKGNVFDRLPFMISSSCTMESLAQFLHAFYRADLLHQVRSIEIAPEGQADRSRFTVKLAIEALALRDAVPREELFPEAEAETSATRLAHADFESYRELTEKPLFSPYVAPRPPTENGIDEAAFVYLTATLEVGDEPVAWLYDRTNNRRHWLRTGQEFDVAGVKGKVLGIAVAERSATLEIDEQTWVLPLGKNLRELEAKSGESGSGG